MWVGIKSLIFCSMCIPLIHTAFFVSPYQNKGFEKTYTDRITTSIEIADNNVRSKHMECLNLGYVKFKKV